MTANPVFRLIALFPAAALGIVLTGCATPSYVWRHSSNDNSLLERDKTQCDYEATLATASYSPNSRGYRTTTVASIADAIAEAQRHAEVFQMCLKARGYYLQKINP